LKLVLDDSRRLTGKGLDWDYEGAILDAFVEGIDKQLVVDTWCIHIQQLLADVGWSQEKYHWRIFEDGVSLLLSAPLDALYAATEINELAWALTCQQLDPFAEKMDDLSVQQKQQEIQQQIQAESNPALLNLIQQAKLHQVDWLLDDDEFSLGLGATCQSWPLTNLPALETIDWKKYASIPVALVTGTNGKSTTVRLASAMINCSGIRCGVTSTDFVKVGNELIDEGDYSGPMGARLLLRHPKTQVALLEVARGGLLRRGLVIPEVEVALITNIAEDHFGQYGINNLDTLTQAKCIVAKAIHPQGIKKGQLILNADDAQLVKAASKMQHMPQNISWFSLHENSPVLKQYAGSDGQCFVRNENIIYRESGARKNTENAQSKLQQADEQQETLVLPFSQIPMTCNGAALHNVQNALAAVSLARRLGIDWNSIRHGLQSFQSNLNDNPGRGNFFKYNNAQVIMDFAHNAHGMKAMALMAKNIPAKRKMILISSAGDRSDLEIKNMTAAALEMQPDLLVIAEIKDYLRGRELNEVPQLISSKAIALGMKPEQIIQTESSLEGAEKILAQIQPNELALLMALTQREEIAQLINKNYIE